jgi:transposase-like protein
MGRSKKAKKCPHYGSSDVFIQDSFDDGFDLYLCADCGQEFEVDSSGKREVVTDYLDSDNGFDYAEEEWEN